MTISSFIVYIIFGIMLFVTIAMFINEVVYLIKELWLHKK